MQSRHIPVLPAEVIEFLAPAPGQTLLDATVGSGGHARILAQQVGPSGRLIVIDRDETMLQNARAGLADFPVSLFQANFDDLLEVLGRLGMESVDGVLADLGICSDQIDAAERGFSFQQDGPLDMRLDPSHSDLPTAADLLRRLGERQLADLFWEYGEERFSRRIARRIVEVRGDSPLKTTHQLAQLVRRCIPQKKEGRHPIDPATRVFQALRIAVNDELGSLDRFLARLPAALKPGGRAVIISFHSLEDRRVKQCFRNREAWEILTPKPIQAREEELRNNPRARSAKLRAARRREFN